MIKKVIVLLFLCASCNAATVFQNADGTAFIGASNTVYVSDWWEIIDSPEVLAWWDISYGQAITGTNVTAYTNRQGVAAVQGTAATQPKTGISSTNGYNLISFISQDNLSTAYGAVDLNADGNVSFFLVVDIIGQEGNSAAAAMSWNHGNTNDWQLDGNASQATNWVGRVNPENEIGDDISLTGGPYVNTGLNIFEVRYDYTRGLCSAWVNGTLRGSAAYTTGKIFPTASMFRFMCSKTATLRETHGHVGDAVILHYVNEVDSLKITGALAWKFGIQDKLPDGYPYKYVRP